MYCFVCLISIGGRLKHAEEASSYESRSRFACVCIGAIENSNCVLGIVCGCHASLRYAVDIIMLMF